MRALRSLAFAGAACLAFLLSACPLASEHPIAASDLDPELGGTWVGEGAGIGVTRFRILPASERGFSLRVIDYTSDYTPAAFDYQGLAGRVGDEKYLVLKALGGEELYIYFAYTLSPSGLVTREVIDSFAAAEQEDIESPEDMAAFLLRHQGEDGFFGAPLAWRKEIR